jgi:hypothetical protein
MARKVGQIIARGDGRWLIRVYPGRDRETNQRNYHNRTIHGSLREAQAYLTRKLREGDLGGQQTSKRFQAGGKKVAMIGDGVNKPRSKGRSFPLAVGS